MRGFLDLLRLPGFARLQAALFVNGFGNWMLTIALPLYVLHVTGSPLQTAATLSIEIVVRLSCGQFAGVWVDRWNRRVAFAGVSAIQALAVLPLATLHGQHPKIFILYAVTAVQSLLGTITGPSIGALIPTVVPREHRVQANGFGSVASDLTQLVGGAAGGLVLGVSGLPLVVGIDAVTFLVAALLLARRLVDGENPAGRPAGGRRSVLADWREGLGILRRSRELIGVFVVGFVIFFGQGLYLVLFVVFAIRTAHVPDNIAGTLRAVVAAGSLVGGGALALIGDRIKPHILTFIGLVGSGVFIGLAWNGPLFHAPTIYYVAMFGCAGIPNVAAYVGMATIFQDAAPPRAMGRVFSLFGAITSSSSLIGLFVASLLTAHLPIQLVLDIQALAFIAGGIVGWPLLRPRPRASDTAAATDAPALDAVLPEPINESA
jgi:MFS family permease